MLLTGLLEVGRTTGQTVRRLFIPYWKPAGEEEPEGEGEGEGKEDRTNTSHGKNDAGDTGKGGKGKNKDEGGKKGEKDKPKSAKNKKRESSGTKSDGKEKVVTAKEEDGIQEEVVPITLNRHWFNYVCYGLPNLMVTQVQS